VPAYDYDDPAGVTMKPELFNHVIEQLNLLLWTMARWEKFALEKYGYPKDDMSENHYFLYVIPRVIVLHGYVIHCWIRICRIMSNPWLLRSESYFSCNPANINMERTIETFENGWDMLNIHGSVDDLRHKEVRGQASNFSESYKNILKLLDGKLNATSKGPKTYRNHQILIKKPETNPGKTPQGRNKIPPSPPFFW